MSTQKARPVFPPELDTPSMAARRSRDASLAEGMVEVDMTKLYYTVGALTVTTVGLTGVTAWMWRRVKRTEEYQAALRDYVSRLVNKTECGKEAYVSLIRDIEEEEKTTADWSDDEGVIFPEYEEVD